MATLKYLTCCHGWLLHPCLPVQSTNVVFIYPSEVIVFADGLSHPLKLLSNLSWMNATGQVRSTSPGWGEATTPLTWWRLTYEPIHYFCWSFVSPSIRFFPETPKNVCPMLVSMSQFVSLHHCCSYSFFTTFQLIVFRLPQHFFFFYSFGICFYCVLAAFPCLFIFFISFFHLYFRRIIFSFQWFLPKPLSGQPFALSFAPHFALPPSPFLFILLPFTLYCCSSTPLVTFPLWFSLSFIAFIICRK